VPSPSPAPLVIWDFDGTVADTYTAIRHATHATLTAHGFVPCDDDVLRLVVGRSLPDVLVHAAGLTESDVDPALVASLVSTYRTVFATAGPTHSTVFPGIGELLVDLADAGVTSVVATSRFRPSIDQMIDHLGLVDRFASVHSTSDLAPDRGKPLPDLVLRACEVAGRAPSDAIVVGDAAVDVIMGRAAGTTTVAVTWGNGTRDALVAAAADHVVEDPTMLQPLLGL
jgi:phosphoglycolate phosphatase